MIAVLMAVYEPRLDWLSEAVAVEHVYTEEYGAKAARLKNSHLSKCSLDAGGFKRFPGWEASLETLLKEDRSS